jgi:hypothetical protein
LQQLSLKGFYQTHHTFDNTVRAIYVQDISVPSSVVWDCLLFDASHSSSTNAMNWKPWFRRWRGVHYTHDPAHQTQTFQTNALQQSTSSSVTGTWRVHSTSYSSSTTRVSLVVDQTVSWTSWLPYLSSSAWVTSIVSQSTKRLTQCIESRARQQQQKRTIKGLFSNRSNKHNAKTPLLEDSFVPMAPKVEEPIGLKRYALVSTVFVLAFYNIHLYLSQ